MAVILGGLMMWGLQPGPMLFKENPEFVWGLIGSIWVANAIGVVMVLSFVPFFASILRAPFSILMPSIVFVCAIGAYAVNNRMIDIWYMILFGFVGMAFKKLDYPIAPMVLALVLAMLGVWALGLLVTLIPSIAAIDTASWRSVRDSASFTISMRYRSAGLA